MKNIETKLRVQSPLHRHWTLRAFPVGTLAVCGIAMLGQCAFGSVAQAFPAGDLPIPGALAESGLLRVGQNASFAVTDISGKEGEPLLLKLSLPSNPAATYSFLMFQGLPPKFALSAGFATKNQWAVSLNDVEGLRLIPPPGYRGSFVLDVLLVKGKDIEPERRSMTVEFYSLPPATTGSNDVFGSQVLTSNRQDAGLDTAPPKPIAKKTPTPQLMDDEDRLTMERGDALFRQGDVSAARLIFHRMAKKGITEAALAMARTYDPDVLKPLKVEGLQPDVAQARVWYRIADELGSAQARNRLLTLRGE